MVRRAQYIKHPSHLPIRVKQKKDCARGLPVTLRPLSERDSLREVAELAFRWGNRSSASEREFANRSDEQHRALRTRSATATRIVLRVRSDP